LALSFIPSDAGLLILQAGVVAAPRPVGQALADRIHRLHGRGWALIPVASIVGVIFMIRYASDSATWLTYLALVAVPILAAIALGWASHGSRWWFSVIAIGLFLLAWRSPGTLRGEGAAAMLSALSNVTLGVLLAAVTPSKWLKLGIIAMAGADVWLVASDLLQAPNNALVSAAPGGGLPQLQSESFGTVNMGYGDMFVAGLLGGVLAHRRRVQLAAAASTLVVAAVFDLLFLVVNELPATVPVALTLVFVELWDRVSARGGRSPQEDAIPPPAR